MFPLVQNLRTVMAFGLHFQYGLLSEKDEQLPFGRHVVRIFQYINFIEHLIFVVFMRTKEVVISNPKSQIVVGAFDVVKPVRMTIRSFIGTVQTLDHLLKRPVFCGDGIVIGKTNDLSDLKGKVLAEVPYEFHCGKRIGAVTVSDELKVFRQFRKSLKSHAHGEDAGPNAPVVRYLIANDRAGGSIHYEPDVGFDTTDLDISFISSENSPFFVRVLIDEGFDADGRSFTVVGNLLM